MFKDIKAFLSSFIQKIKERKLLKKYLGITIAVILAILIPLIIAICYVQFKVPSEANAPTASEISIVLFDNDGHTIASGKAFSDKTEESPLVDTVYKMINAKTSVKKPENFERTPTFNLTVSSNNTPVTYKCYFDTAPSTSFVEDNAGSFFSMNADEYTAFLHSEFSQVVYPYSAPPSLTLGEKDLILPSTVVWEYKTINGEALSSTNYKTTEDIQSYIIDGAIDFMFSTQPTECTVKMSDANDDVIFDGSLEEISTFTANEGDSFNVFIDAEWVAEDDSDAFGALSYHFQIICSKPSTIEISSASLFGGDVLTISVSDVTNADSILYSIKSELNLPDEASGDEASGLSPAQATALKQLYGYVPTFAKCKNDAYAFIPIPRNLPKTTFEISISYGISKKDFTISVDSRHSSASISLTDDEKISISEEKKQEFADLISLKDYKSSDILLFTNEFLSPSQYGFTKSIDFGTKVFTDEVTSFNFFATSYLAPTTTDLSVKSANVGIVVDIGYSDLLGNYVAVDHGIGLYSWYCGLSSLNASKGDVLKKGDPLGQSGSTSALCKNGVNVFFTLDGLLIDPSAVLENGLI